MIQEYDLHCHTTASDGRLSPAALVERAHERGVRTLAITDHDTVAGYREALPTAKNLGLRLIPGIELSCVWGGATLHIVGLDFDPESDAMRDAEHTQRCARIERADIIAQRLAKCVKQPIDMAEVSALAGGEVGRPHFAQYLVNHGLAADMASAFKKYLGAGKPGDVKTSWPALYDAVQWIVAAGGIPVMAHAHLYKMTRTKLRACLDDFVAAGGQGLEVAYGLMDNNQRGQMAALAREYQLLGSCGSDYHGPNRFGLDLGVMPPFPHDVTPVWNRFSA